MTTPPLWNIVEQQYAPETMPKTPALYWHFESSEVFAQDLGTFSPGVTDNLHCSLVNFEYVDPYMDMDEAVMTFEDPSFELIEHPGVKEFTTTMTFSFGFEDNMTATREMVLYRIEQDYNETGRITTRLTFFSKGILIGHFKRSHTYTAASGGEVRARGITLKDVAQQIARRHGLKLVFEEMRNPVSQTEWVQSAKSDNEFLKSIIASTNPMSARTGESAYRMKITNNELRIGPTLIETAEVYRFVYRAPGSVLKSFRPQLAGDKFKGAGYMTSMAGIDQQTGLQYPAGHGGPTGSQNDAGMTNDEQGRTGYDQIGAKTHESPAPTRPTLRNMVDQKPGELDRLVTEYRETVTMHQSVLNDRANELPSTVAQKNTSLEELITKRAYLKNQIEIAASASRGNEDYIRQQGVSDITTRRLDPRIAVWHDRMTRIDPRMLEYVRQAATDSGMSYEFVLAMALRESGEFKTNVRYPSTHRLAGKPVWHRPEPNTNNWLMAKVLGHPRWEEVKAPIKGRPRACEPGDSRCRGNASYGPMQLLLTNAVINDIYRAQTSVDGENPTQWREPFSHPVLNESRMNFRIAGQFIRSINTDQFFLNWKGSALARARNESYEEWVISVYNAYHDGNQFPKRKDDGRLAGTEGHIESVMAYFRVLNGNVSELEVPDYRLANQSRTAAFSDDVRALQKNSEHNLVTATADFWGFPSLLSGMPIRIDGVAPKFRGKWYVKEVRHRYDRQSGLTTTADLSRNPVWAVHTPPPREGDTGARKRTFYDYFLGPPASDTPEVRDAPLDTPSRTLPTPEQAAESFGRQTEQLFSIPQGNSNSGRAPNRN